MKSFSFLLALLVSSFLFVACEGDAGPEGPKGASGDAGVAGAKGDKGGKGDTGVTGANGNTEVLIFERGGSVLAAGVGVGRVWNFSSTEISRTRAEASGIYVYLQLPREPEEWVAMPGTVFFPGGSHQSFSQEVTFTNTNTSIGFYRSEGTGELAYTKVKVIFIPRATTARQAAVDYSDYEAVKKHYNLPD